MCPWKSRTAHVRTNCLNSTFCQTFPRCVGLNPSNASKFPKSRTQNSGAKHAEFIHTRWQIVGRTRTTSWILKVQLATGGMSQEKRTNFQETICCLGANMPWEMTWFQSLQPCLGDVEHSLWPLGCCLYHLRVPFCCHMLLHPLLHQAISAKEMHLAGKACNFHCFLWRFVDFQCWDGNRETLATVPRHSMEKHLRRMKSLGCTTTGTISTILQGATGNGKTSKTQEINGNQISISCNTFELVFERIQRIYSSTSGLERVWSGCLKRLGLSRHDVSQYRAEEWRKTCQTDLSRCQRNQPRLFQSFHAKYGASN